MKTNKYNLGEDIETQLIGNRGTRSWGYTRENFVSPSASKIMNTNLLDLNTDVLNIIYDYFKKDNLKEKIKNKKK